MPTIKVVKAFNLLGATNEKPQRFEIGEHEVSDEIAGHWYVQQHLFKPVPAAAAFDPATANRGELAAWLQAMYSAYIATLDDDQLREIAAKHRADEAAEDEGQPLDLSLAPSPRPLESSAAAGDPKPGTEDTGPGTGAAGQTDAGAGTADTDPAARKAAIREQLKAMDAKLPHHNAGLDKHEDALAAAQAAQGQPEAAPTEQPQPEAPAASQPVPESAAEPAPEAAPAAEQAAAPAADTAAA